MRLARQPTAAPEVGGPLELDADVAVVGGGLMGLGIAWRVAQAGRSVVCVDGAAAGQGASWAAAGMLAPYAELDFDEVELLELAESSQRMWPEFADELAAAASADVGFDPCGSLVVAVDRDDAEAQERLFAYQRARGLDVARLGGAACREREPLLSPRVHSGTWSPGEHQVDPRRLLPAVELAATRAGARVFRGASCVRVDVSAGEVTGVAMADGGRVRARQVVVAAGAWSRAVDGLEPHRPPVRPVKGQMLAVARDPALTLGHVVRSPDAYLAPKADRWVVGATSEDRGFDDRVTAGGVWELLDGAYAVVPSIYELELVEVWTGFRPASRDNGPILGGCAVDGLFFCTGHYRNGIQQAPASIDGVAKAVLGRDVPATLAPFGVGRFGGAARGGR